MNKSGEKVNKVQLGEDEKCLADYRAGKLGMTVEACTTADRKQKVQNAFLKTKSGEDNKCLPPLPPFGYNDSDAVNNAARDGALALIHHIFGDPVDDADLATNADKQKVKCQKTMLQQAGTLEKTILGQINKAKKEAIKAGVPDAAALENALDAVFTEENPKIEKKQTKLQEKVNGKCADVTDPPGVVFPGVCADPVLNNVSDCVIEATRCEACRKINAFDGLSLDCDNADDGLANGTCPVPVP